MFKLNESELIARSAKRRGSHCKQAVLRDNLDALLRLRAAGVSYQEIANAFAEQGMPISAATIWRFLKNQEEAGTDLSIDQGGQGSNGRRRPNCR